MSVVDFPVIVRLVNRVARIEVIFRVDVPVMAALSRCWLFRSSWSFARAADAAKIVQRARRNGASMNRGRLETFSDGVIAFFRIESGPSALHSGAAGKERCHPCCMLSGR